MTVIINKMYSNMMLASLEREGKILNNSTRFGVF
jgi:hypothetical protein